MLVQAQVVPWWGTGRPAEFSPSRSNPSRASPTGRRIGGYDYKTESFQRPRAGKHTRSREMTKAFLRDFGKCVREVDTCFRKMNLPPASGVVTPVGASWLGEDPHGTQK